MTLNNPDIIEASDFDEALLLTLNEVDGAPVVMIAMKLKPHRQYADAPIGLLIPFPSEPIIYYAAHPQDFSLMFEETVQLPAVAPASTTESAAVAQAVLESAESTESESAVASVPASGEGSPGESVDPTPAKTNGKAAKKGMENASAEDAGNG